MHQGWGNGKCKGSPKPQQPQELEAAAKPQDGKPTKRTKVGVKKDEAQKYYKDP